MAPQKKKAPAALDGWEEADLALRRMGEIDISMAQIQGDMTLRINAVKAEAEAKGSGMRAERKALEKLVTSFCEARKEEFTKKRSKELTWGTVAYKVTTKIVIRAKEACVAALEALGLKQYVRVQKEPDKELMLHLDDHLLAKVGARRELEDKLRIEPNIEKLREVV